METIKLETGMSLIDNIITAYNKIYDTPITILDVSSLILDVPFIKLNGKEITWDSVNLSK